MVERALVRGIFFTGRNASSPNRIAVILALVVAVLLSTPISGEVEAGELHALINGKAAHLDTIPGTTFNENNWGGGIQYDFDPWNDDWIPFLNVSGFSDSNSNPSYYAGGGLMRRFILSEELDNLHVDLGAVAFLMTRKGYRNNRPFFGGLPVASIGTDRIAINVTYIPKVDPKMVQLLFFQLKIKILEF